MNTLTIIITIATYFLLLFSVSYLAGRKADNAGFFVGNRKSKWWVVAVATMGSFISGVTFVSVPGMVAEKGFSYLQMVMGFVVGQFVIAREPPVDVASVVVGLHVGGFQSPVFAADGVFKGLPEHRRQSLPGHLFHVDGRV